MWQRVGSMGNVEELIPLAEELLTSWSNQGSSTAHRVKGRLHAACWDVIPGSWDDALLVALAPNGLLPMHKDDWSYLARYHLVLSANDRCWNFHDGDWFQVQPGEIYLMDPTLLHAAVNFGSTTRIHLVVDSKEHYG